MPEPLFHAYIFVDWSAANVPTLGADSIWVGHAVREDRRLAVDEPVNLATRAEAGAWLLERLLEHVRAGRRVLVGFDFSLGYSAGFAAALCGEGAIWREVWGYLAEHLVDGDDNANNRFELASIMNQQLGGVGPFWGCPAKAATEYLRPRRQFDWPLLVADAALARLRQCERVVPRAQETWKLSYIGSVGSQTLTGIPRVHRLRHDAELTACTRVWPFEATDASTQVVLAEMYPRRVEDRVTKLRDRFSVKDAAQVYAMCRFVAEEDRAGNLPRFFSAADGGAVAAEEGWILGY